MRARMETAPEGSEVGLWMVLRNLARQEKISDATNERLSTARLKRNRLTDAIHRLEKERETSRHHEMGYRSRISTIVSTWRNSISTPYTEILTELLNFKNPLLALNELLRAMPYEDRAEFIHECHFSWGGVKAKFWQRKRRRKLAEALFYNAAGLLRDATRNQASHTAA